ALSATSPAKITQLKLNELFGAIATDPASFGFTNTTDSCLTNFQPGFVFEGICDNPDEFVFWDNVHPTAAAHGEIAQFAIAALYLEVPQNGTPQSVPEPTGVIGLLLLGGAALTVSKRAKQLAVS
ncbi:MAG: PEP-CTERM sorting domain-containing protein, partial [Phormidesmis sp.]